MPEFVSATLLTMTTCIALRANSGSALSNEAHFANAQVVEVFGHFDSAFSLKTPQTDLLDDLDRLAAEHSTPGWDGNEAPAVSYVTRQNASNFIAALPSTIALPELAVDPDDASISLEWAPKPFHVFSVSIGESSRLPFAGMRGADRWHGAVVFDGIKIPDLILDHIRRFA